MLPKFSNYNEEGKVDAGYEALQDFILNWTLKCAVEIHKDDNKLLNEYAKRVVFALLFGKNEGNILRVNYKNFESFKVLKINTKRQFNKIDLLAEIKISILGIEEDYLLNIEDKWYSNIRENQLSNYLKVIENEYNSTNFKIVNMVVFADHIKIENPIEKEKCEKNGYQFTNMDELKDLAETEKYGETGNYMFDEFWVRK